MVSLFDTLARAEQSHMNTVSAVYKNLTGSDLTTIEQGWAPGPQDIMEGGVSMGDALNWARGKSGIAILEYSMSLEARSYDLYLSMAGRVEDEKTSNMLAEVSREEWAHLTKMSALIEKLS
jgi:rubrerythrin